MSRKQVRLLSRVWGLIQEPRQITLLLAFGLYSPALLVGVWWITSAGLGGPSIRDWVALLLTLGGAISVLGAIPGEWALERVGITALLFGWSAHLALTATNPALIDFWDEAAQFSLICALGVRMLRTWGVPRDPKPSRVFTP